MESTVWFNVWLMILFVATLATLILLYLRAEKNLHRQAQESSTLLQQVTTLAVQSAEERSSAAEEAASRAQEQAKQMLDATMEQLQASQQTLMGQMDRSQTLAQKAMDLTLTRALDGLAKTETHMATLLQSSLILPRTTDTRAYSQAMAASIPAEDTLEPYPGMDETEEQRLAEEQREHLGTLDAAVALLASMGAPQDAST